MWCQLIQGPQTKWQDSGVETCLYAQLVEQLFSERCLKPPVQKNYNFGKSEGNYKVLLMSKTHAQ